MNGFADFHCADLVNAIPVPLFLVDDDVRILDLNAAATTTFGVTRHAVYQRRGGEALHCLHSQDVPEGCGRAPACRQCIIRNSVSSSLTGITATRRRMKFELRTGPQKTELELLISASPFLQANGKLVLLIVEDITEMSKLRSIIPICAQCKRIRNDAEYWEQVDGYFHEYIGVDFSHGLCPQCLEKLYGDYLTKTPPAEPTQQ
ncbi:MAG: PAS domain-containing protein [Terriglobales bacterium]